MKGHQLFNGGARNAVHHIVHRNSSGSAAIQKISVNHTFNVDLSRSARDQEGTIKGHVHSKRRKLNLAIIPGRQAQTLASAV